VIIDHACFSIRAFGSRGFAFAPNLAFFAAHDERPGHFGLDHGGIAMHLRVGPGERLGMLIVGFDVIYDFFDRRVKRHISQSFFSGMNLATSRS
jgi:hypothetical protein